MGTPQMGIFALGTSAHGYLELTAAPGVGATELVRASRVSRCRPPNRTPGCESPATPRNLVFDICSSALDVLKDIAGLATEVTGWAYRDSRDLTGFEDGTENPPLAEAVPVVAVPDGAPGAGSTVVLVQQWSHDRAAWESLDVEVQEHTMGRTKPDSIELAEDVMPADSHVSRTVIEDADGLELAIFRRNTPYGSVRDHGTMFVGFSREQARSPHPRLSCQPLRAVPRPLRLTGRLALG